MMTILPLLPAMMIRTYLHGRMRARELLQGLIMFPMIAALTGRRIFRHFVCFEANWWIPAYLAWFCFPCQGFLFSSVAGMSYDSTRVSGLDVPMDFMRNVYDDKFLDRTTAGIISSGQGQMCLSKWQMNGYLDVPAYHHQLQLSLASGL